MSYHKNYLKKKAVSLIYPVYHNAYKSVEMKLIVVSKTLKLTIRKQVWKIVPKVTGHFLRDWPERPEPPC